MELENKPMNVSGAGQGEPTESDLAQLVALFQQGRYAELTGVAAALGKRFPGAFALHQLAGLLLGAAGVYGEAEPFLARAAGLQPDDADVHMLHATTLWELGRPEPAARAFARTVALAPDNAEAQGRLGMALYSLARCEEALEAFAHALALDPANAQHYNNRGVVLQDLARFDEAAQSYEAALTLRRDHVDALANLGAVRKEQGRTTEALDLLEQALARDPAHPGAWDNFGAALGEVGRVEEAIAANARALALQPGSTGPFVRSIELKTRICDWSGYSDFASVAASLGIAGPAVPPHPMLALDDDPARQGQRAARYGHQAFRNPSGAGRFTAPALARTDGKLRVGYFSADFHDHATMHLLAGLLRAHDHDRFEIHAFSYGIDRDDKMRRLVVQHSDHFRDMRRASDREFIEQARGAGLDLAIDLKGYTIDHRCQIFAERVAPVQVSYLGFPGSLGAPCFDYIVADAHVIPPDAREHYSEAVLFMPGSYQANDNARAIGPATSRYACGLPEGALVFACFNACSKISPDVFAIWMRLLHRLPDSVLWLFRSNLLAEKALRAAAAAQGVDPARLHFADRLPPADHLARIGLADLFLDTFAVNAHTTASDALWAGLPVLTMAGKSFAARVAASLLHAAGLPELVTTSHAAYEALAFDLARDPARLGALRARLIANRDTCALFDTVRFTRALEAGYGAMHARAVQGLPPADIVLA